jgi:hypothetical protein
MVPLTVLEAAWLQAAVVLPLLFHTLSYRVFEPEKSAALRLLAVIEAAVLTVGLWRERSSDSFAWGRLRLPLGLVAVAVLAWACVSSALSLDPWQSLLGSYHRQGGLVTLAASITLFIAVAVGLRSWKDVDRLLSAIALAGTAVALYALAQRAGLDPVVWDAAGWGGDPIVRTPGSLGNPTFLAGFLALSVFVTAARGRAGLAVWTLLAVQAAGLWAAGSRACGAGRRTVGGREPRRHRGRRRWCGDVRCRVRRRDAQPPIECGDDRRDGERGGRDAAAHRTGEPAGVAA